MSAAENAEIAIPVSRSKIGFLAIASLGMAAVACWVLFSAPGVKESSFRQGVLGLGAAFFLLGAWLQFRDLLQREPGLVVNRQGFLFRLTGLQFGWVDWADVIDVKEGRTRGGAFVLIKLRDPWKYIARGNWLQRLAKAINWRLSGSPVTITSGSLQATPAELGQIIRAFFTEAKQAESQPLSSGPPAM